MLVPNTILQGRYRVIQHLGRGGMGAVYQAMDEHVSCVVAVKETFAATEEQRRAFKREAELLANLSHPALPTVKDHFIQDNGQFLVMQFVAGYDLAELLKLREKPFTTGTVLEWADQLLDALEELHAYDPPIIHRDIKPANLKLTPRGKVMLLDFGLAKGVAGQMSTVDADSYNQSIYGYTRNYAPLEQMRGIKTDARSDLYALAATLWSLLTAQLPPDALARVGEKEDGKPDPLQQAHEINPEVTPAVSAVLHQAMALNRLQRPPSAAEMRRSLSEAAHAPARDVDEERGVNRIEEMARARLEREAAGRRRAEALAWPEREDKAAARAIEEAVAAERLEKERQERKKQEEEEHGRRRAAEDAARRAAAALDQRHREEERRRREAEAKAESQRRAEAEARRKLAAPTPPQGLASTPPRQAATPPRPSPLNGRAVLPQAGVASNARPPSSTLRARHRRLALIAAIAFVSSIFLSTIFWILLRGRESEEQPAAVKSTNEASATESKSPTPVLREYEFETVTINASGKVTDRHKATARVYTETLGGVTLEMVEIRGGSFQMGSPASEDKRNEDEGPQHQVTLKPFYMGKYEVTQAQWRAVANLPKVNRDLTSDPAQFKGESKPVEKISWEDAQEFCARLSKATGREYRLPTEAEWEYACRAGTQTPYAFGETITPEFVNYDGNFPYANAPKGIYRETTVPVGSLGIANAFGLYDMHGNVWEWCGDAYHPNYQGAPTDGSAWESGATGAPVVLRGGGWYIYAHVCRSAHRVKGDTPVRNALLGLRVVATAKS